MPHPLLTSPVSVRNTTTDESSSAETNGCRTENRSPYVMPPSQFSAHNLRADVAGRNFDRAVRSWAGADVNVT